MNRRLTAITVRLLALAAAAAVPAAASAQNAPPISTSHRVAQSAASKLNARTDAINGAGSRTAAAPAGTRPSSSTAIVASRPTGAPATPAATAPAAANAGSRPTNGAQPQVAVRMGNAEAVLMREVFDYDRAGRRDPFKSLIKSGDLRPMISDLKLVAVLYDPVGRSWAILRDLSSKEQYRVKVGQQLGRMRVTQIHPKSVTFTIEEIGFNRQQTLTLNDTAKERGK